MIKTHSCRALVTYGMELKHGLAVALSKSRLYMKPSVVSRVTCVIYGPEDILRQSDVIKLTISPIIFS